MPIQIPPIDDRTYSDLLQEALARIPVHTPEWTNFNNSDPGVTLIEVFAFLTDSLLYRAKQIPERNRLKFLSLLGIPLAPGSCAQGIVTLSNTRGDAVAPYIAPGLELTASKVPFHTVHGVYALPIEGQVFYKKKLAVDNETRTYYEEQYHQLLQENAGVQLDYYETTLLAPPTSEGTDLATAIDGSLWIALLCPPRQSKTDVRQAIGGKVLTLGVVPVVDAQGLALGPSSNAQAVSSTWRIDYARNPGPNETANVVYEPLVEVAAPIAPTVIEVRLPDAAKLDWASPPTVPPGIDDLPPTIEDREQNERLITWLRVSVAGGTKADGSPAAPATPLGKLLWTGINAVRVTQRAAVRGERLPDGTGEPDQSLSLAKRSVLFDSTRLTVNGTVWDRVDDLFSAGPEVIVSDPKLPPGVKRTGLRPSQVYKVDAEAGVITFGDGLHGARPPRDAAIRVDYDVGVGAAGNVAEGSIRGGPLLPTGIKVGQPIRTWGGADAESVRDGEKQIARSIQHRDRLVTAVDFDVITQRVPGIVIGRIEVLPAYHPERSLGDGSQDAPGVVTLVVIPAFDPRAPDTPVPDSSFLRAIADFLEPRRLVTTEVLLRGPTYKPLWISLGIKTVPGISTAEIMTAVEKAIRAHLSPLPDPGQEQDARWSLASPAYAARRRGWPLWQPVRAQELAAVASRVDGVAWVEGVLLGSDVPGDSDSEIAMTRLELPRIAGISVVSGQPRSIAELRAAQSPPTPEGTRIVPVPAIPKDC